MWPLKITLLMWSTWYVAIYLLAASGHVECLKILIQNAEDRQAVDCLDELERYHVWNFILPHSDIYYSYLWTTAIQATIRSKLTFRYLFMFRTPLMTAVAHGHMDTMLVLLDLGANIHAQDVYRRTALHRAVSKTYMFCVCVIHNCTTYIAHEHFSCINAILLIPPCPIVSMSLKTSRRNLHNNIQQH